MPQLSESVKSGEWLKWLTNRDFCLGVLTLKTTTNQTIKPGSLLEVDGDGHILVAVGTVASVVGIAVIENDLVATGGEKVLCLVRGPAVVDSDKLSYETDVTWAGVAAAFAALDIRPAQSALADWTTQTY